MCRVLGVSISGYYDWRGREPSAHEREDGELAKEIYRIFVAHRGVYGSPRVHAELRERGIVVSMSRTGDCYDNAAMESFFSTLKGECVERAFFPTRQEARQTIFEYIECFYNRVRRHSTLNYVSPVEFEQHMR